MKTISIIVPCYNEEDNIENFYLEISKVLNQNAGYLFEVICIEDGSNDNTLQILKEVVTRDSRFKVIELSRNFGKENALSAGIDAAQGDVVILMDSDGQHSSGIGRMKPLPDRSQPCHPLPSGRLEGDGPANRPCRPPPAGVA